jgi:hypothetical protein
MVGLQGIDDTTDLDDSAAGIWQVQEGVAIVDGQCAVGIQQIYNDILLQDFIHQLRRLREPQLGIVGIQELLPEAVESPNDDLIGLNVQIFQGAAACVAVQAGLHLPTRLVSEGDHQDLLRLAPLLNEAQGAQGDDGRLAGTSNCVDPAFS